MDGIDDEVKLSELSIPGTHDSLAVNSKFSDIVSTQTMSLATQLNSGIRFIDVRLRHIDGSFAVHHGRIYLDVMFGDVLNIVTQFLSNNPSETVLMRVKQEYSSVSDEVFNRTLKEYMDRPQYAKYFWDSDGGNVANPSMKEMRGKIVILRNFLGSSVGIAYPQRFKIQDNYHLTTNLDLYNKWLSVKNHLISVNTSSKNDIFINYLSGSGGSFPYFVASGHSSPGTSASRLSTGLTTLTSPNAYPEFPRATGFLGIYTISFEGINILAHDYINNKNLSYVGIVAADFPGKDLIKTVIDINYIDNPDFYNNKTIMIASALKTSSVVDQRNDDKGDVILWDGNGGSWQKFKFVYSPAKDEYQIWNLSRNKILAWNDTGGYEVFMHPNEDKSEHYWQFERQPSGNYLIVNYKNRNLVLDVDDEKTANGTAIKVWNRNKRKAQEFQLKVVDS